MHKYNNREFDTRSGMLTYICIDSIEDANNKLSSDFSIAKTAQAHAFKHGLFIGLPEIRNHVKFRRSAIEIGYNSRGSRLESGNLA